MRVWIQTDSRVRFAAFKKTQNPTHKTEQQKKQTTKWNKVKKKQTTPCFISGQELPLRTDCSCIFSGDYWVNKNCHLRKHIKRSRTHFSSLLTQWCSYFGFFCSSVVSMEWFLQGILNLWAPAAGACSEVKIPNLPQPERSSRARPCSCCVWMSHMVTAFLGA